MDICFNGCVFFCVCVCKYTVVVCTCTIHIIYYYIIYICVMQIYKIYYVMYICIFIYIFIIIYILCTTSLENQRCLAGLMSQGRQLDTIQVRRQVWGFLRRNLQCFIPNLSDAQNMHQTMCRCIQCICINVSCATNIGICMRCSVLQCIVVYCTVM